MGVQHPESARAQDWEAAWQWQAPSRGALAAGRGAERTAPCEGGASRLKGSEAAQTGKRYGPPSRPPPPGAPRAAAPNSPAPGESGPPRGQWETHSSLNPENNFELGWGWGSRSKLLSREPARALFPPEEEAAPVGYSSGSRSESEGGGRGADRPKRRGEPEHRLGVGGRRDYLFSEEARRFGWHSKPLRVIRKDLFCAVACPALPPPLAKFETWLGLEVGAVCWGKGTLSGLWRAGQRCGLCWSVRGAPGYLFPLQGGSKPQPLLLLSPAGALPPPILHSPFPSPSASFQGLGVGWG